MLMKTSRDVGMPGDPSRVSGKRPIRPLSSWPVAPAPLPGIKQYRISRLDYARMKSASATGIKHRPLYYRRKVATLINAANNEISARQAVASDGTVGENHRRAGTAVLIDAGC